MGLSDQALKVVTRAAATALPLDEDVLEFAYTNAAGQEWQGCIEKWLGNDDSTVDPNQLLIEIEGLRYYQIGESGGGADLVLIRDDEQGTVCYYNDYDLTLTEVSSDFDGFLARLREPL